MKTFEELILEIESPLFDAIMNSASGINAVLSGLEEHEAVNTLVQLIKTKSEYAEKNRTASKLFASYRT